MLETKTYLYSYYYETEPNGELSTAYHEEKPSVDLNESRNVEKGTVNFKNKNAITYIKMNETYIKSPLNYVGGKYKILDQIIPKFPTINKKKV